MMAMKIMLSTVLRRYKLKTSIAEAKLEVGVVVKVKGGYKIQLHPRKEATDGQKEQKKRPV